jgi:hypothetical protein
MLTQTFAAAVPANAAIARSRNRPILLVLEVFEWGVAEDEPGLMSARSMSLDIDAVKIPEEVER